MGVLGPIIYFLFEKYGSSINVPGYSIDTIIMAILSGIFSSIFCAGRSGRIPTLTANTYTQGGLQLACMVVSFCFALIFGIITGFVIKCLNQPK
jgi:hypothetical protein